ncbi:MAG: guanylate kinase [Rickettsiales bacterium]|jgi:guanylate kinase|nr:guanylate kinase [Rickettsiales bacterium]
MPELQRRRRGFMLVLSSPSGAGKTTLSRKLLEHDDNIIMSISATTRKPRVGEEDGVDYHFMSTKEFNAKTEADYFWEYEEVFGNHYGTPKQYVQDALATGIDVLFDIDWQGTRRLTQKAREDLVSVFVLPPSMKELERRLRKRGQDDDDVIHRRMARAEEEISHWGEYDYVIVNQNIDDSLRKINHILKAERLRRVRQHALSEFVDTLLHP